MTATSDLHDAKGRTLAELLQAVLEGTATAVGDDFFKALVTTLANVFGVRYAVIGRLVPNNQVRTLAIYADGTLADNISYPLSGTPCETVIGQSPQYFPCGVADIFPQDELLKQLQVECYLGIPLYSSQGKPLGNVLIMDCKPLPEAERELGMKLMPLFALRTAGEIERLEREQMLRSQEIQLGLIAETSHDGLLATDKNGTILAVNPAYCNLLGYSQDELLGMHIREIEATESPAEVEEHTRKMIQEGFDRFVSHHRHKDGTGIPVEMAVSYSPENQRFFAICRDIRQQQQLERELQMSEQRYHAFSELSADFFYTCTRRDNEPYRVQWVGGKFERITGYSDVELLGIGCWLPIVHPDDRERVATTLQLLTPGTVGSCEFRLIRKDHAVRWVREVSRCEHDPENPELIRLYGTSRDITVTRETAQALQTTESAYRTIFNAANDGIFILDPQNAMILDCNNRATELFGRPRQELIGVTPAELSKAGDERYSATESMKRINAVQESGAAIFDWQCQRGDGTLFWTEASLRATEINGRQRLLAIVRDITDRRLMEAQLLRSQFALDRNSDPIFWSDEQGHLIYVNDAACSSLGYERAELMQMNVVDVDSTATDPAKFAAFTAALQQTGATTFETSHRRKDGSSYPAEVSVNLLEYESKRYICGIARNITERKLAAEQMLIASQTAETANRAKSEFLANMSHEVRTPLNGIMGMAQLLRMTGMTSEQQKFMTMLDDSCHTLLTLINDILDISRIEAGRLTIEELPFNLHDLLEQTLQLHRTTALHKGIDLDVAVAPDLPANLLGDPLRIKQILLNLVGNAIKFTAKGSIRLSVTQTGGGDGSDCLLLTVADTGIGIHPDALNRIFEHFTQADTSTTRLYGGSGLGLTICRRLAHLMGGRIWAESEPGNGSRFHVELPLRPAKAVPTTDHCATALDRPAAPVQTALQILLVEDQDVGRKFATAILERRGHQVIPVLDGGMALERLESTSFDLVLLDIQLPGMGGEEVLARIRSMQHCRHLPVIAMTAHAMDGDREQLLALGFNGYCAKPIEISQLQQEIDTVLASAAPERITEEPL